MGNKHLTLFLTFILSSSFGFASCVPGIPKYTPDSMFTDNGDGTITDTVRNLMWRKCSIGQTDDATCTGSKINVAWDNAMQDIESANAGVGFAGYTDWRLPNINELSTIIEHACYSPAINEMYFPGVAGYWEYWSSTTSIEFTLRAWRARFDRGATLTANRNYTASVRWIRTAP